MAVPPEQFGLVLSAGGARAAYQVGVLRHLAKHCPEYSPKVFSGVSAGSINSSFLSQGQPFLEATEKLCGLWSELTLNDIFKTNFRSLFSITYKVFNDLFLSKVTKQLKFNSLLDATPLANLLLREMDFEQIHTAVREGAIQGTSVSATNYINGNATVFFHSHKPLSPWQRRHKTVIATPIRIKHIMASCSLPILFQPVRIGNAVYGDGTIRFSNPIGPTIHMGATHLVAIGTSCPRTEGSKNAEKIKPSLGFVAGAVLNSIFLDSLEPDFTLLKRFNELASPNSAIKKISVALFQPSQDPGRIAKDFFHELPFNFRQLMKAAAISPDEAGDLISYLMFTKGYISALIQLGEKDAANQLRLNQSLFDTK